MVRALTASIMRGLAATAVVAASLGLGCDAFSLPRTPLARPSSHINGGCDGGGGGKYPRRPTWYSRDGDGSDGEDGIACNLAGLYWMSAAPEDETTPVDGTDSSRRDAKRCIMDAHVSTDTPRGGGGVATKESPANSSDDAKKSFGASINDALDSMQTVMFGPLRAAGSALSKAIPANPFKKSTDGQSDEAKLKEQQQLLTSTKVQSVSAPGSDLLPPDVVTQCAQESNLIGGTLTPETLEATAKMINRQYLQQGYVMNSVTGATLVPGGDGEEGHVELKVREVKLAHSGKGGSSPVHIGFVEKIDSKDAVDDEGAVSLRMQSVQIAYKSTSGRTRASKLARMVNLTPGSHFCILPDLWSHLSVFPGSGMLGGSGKGGGKSAIFSTIHAIRPVPTSLEGNTVELDILATENKPYASLEYGVTKSLYSDQWEGELDVKHANAFGGGEVATLNVRKGANRGTVEEDAGLKNWNRGVKGGPLNWRMSIKDDYLNGSGAGYDVDVFRDHVGVGGTKGQTAATPAKEEDSEQEESEPSEEDAPLRMGATMRLRLPSKAKTSFLPQSLSARLERVDPFSKNDRAQCMASMSADIGPYQHRLRSLHSAISATVSSGRRWNAGSKSGESGNTLPYGSGTVTSQLVLPLNEEGSLPSAELAVRNVVSASSRNLPRHEAISLGVASRIRGYRYNYSQSPSLHEPAKAQKKEPQSPLQSFKQFVRGGDRDQFRPPIALAKSVSGTAEVRVPFERLTKQRGSGTVVVFGDWCFAQAQPPSSTLLSEAEPTSYDKPFRHSSVGIGLRQVVQGLPLKVDACITEHGSKGMFFGIGQ